MRITIGNWTITDEKGRSKRDFWWTPDDGKIRPDASSFVEGRAEPGEIHPRIHSIRREFYTLRAFTMTAIGLPIFAIKKWIKSAQERKFELAYRFATAGVLAFAARAKAMDGVAAVIGSIAYETAERGGWGVTTSFTWDHTISGSGPILVIGSGGISTSGSPTQSHSWDGGGMTGSAQDYTYTTCYSLISYKEAPGTGTKSCSASIGGSGTRIFNAGASSYTGAAQSSALDNSGNTHALANCSGSVTTNSADTMTVQMAQAASGSITSNTSNGGANNRWSGNSEYYTGSMGDTFSASASTSVTISASHSSTAQSSVCAIVLKTGSQTFNQSVPATGAGVSAVVKSVGKNVASTGASTASIIKQVGKTLTSTGGAIATTIKGMAKTLAVGAVGAAGLAASRVYLKAVSAVASASASILFLNGKVLSAVASATADIQTAIGKTISAVGQAQSNVVKQVGKTVRAIGAGQASVSRVVGKVLASVGNGVAVITKNIGYTKLIEAVGDGVATVLAARAKILNAVANASADMTLMRAVVVRAIANTISKMRVDFWRTKYHAQSDVYDEKYHEQGDNYNKKY